MIHPKPTRWLSAILLTLFAYPLLAQPLFKSAKEERILIPTLSFSQVSENGQNLRTLPRLSIASNYRWHYGWGKFGIFGGLWGNNWGTIVRDNDITYKTRVLALTPEAGIRFGWNKGAVSLGVGPSIPFHLKYKTLDGRNKNKSDFWFDYEQMNTFVPTASIGLAYKFLDMKLQYYLGSITKNEGETTDMIYAFTLGLNQLHLKKMISDFDFKPKSKKKDKKTQDEEDVKPLKDKADVIKASWKG